jgi:hypothetical protein
MCGYTCFFYVKRKRKEKNEKFLAILLALTMWPPWPPVRVGQLREPAPRRQRGPQPLPPLPSPAADVPQIGSGKLLRVGMECAYAPYNWTQPNDRTGRPDLRQFGFCVGYDVMMAKYLAEKMGTTGWKFINRLGHAACRSGCRRDRLRHRRTVHHRERLLSVDFTTPYYYASIVALTKKTPLRRRQRPVRPEGGHLHLSAQHGMG